MTENEQKDFCFPVVDLQPDVTDRPSNVVQATR